MVTIRTCQATGVKFEHVQTGRGRPPIYCPEERKRRANEAYVNPVLKLETTSAAPKSGDKALYVPFGKYGQWDKAMRDAQMVEVLRIDGSEAIVYRIDRKFSVPVEELVAIRA